ncbi:hypothetical protein ACTXT7_016204 [Hymenolepis weldensis]
MENQERMTAWFVNILKELDPQLAKCVEQFQDGELNPFPKPAEKQMPEVMTAQVPKPATTPVPASKPDPAIKPVIKAMEAPKLTHTHDLGLVPAPKLAPESTPAPVPAPLPMSAPAPSPKPVPTTSFKSTPLSKPAINRTELPKPLPTPALKPEPEITPRPLSESTPKPLPKPPPKSTDPIWQYFKEIVNYADPEMSKYLEVCLTKE